MKNSAAILMLAASLSPLALAAEKTFVVGKSGMDARQIVVIESDTTFENFTARTAKISGNLKFDPEKKTGSGKIMVDLASLDTGIPTRDEHMRSPQWLDVAKYPTATFEITGGKFVKGDEYNITGKFTLHGVTKNISVKARVRYAPESAKTKSNYFQGDVLQVQTKFNIKLSDYGVKIAPVAKDKVNDELTVSFTAFGDSK